jgi:hypothetical protein
VKILLTFRRLNPEVSDEDAIGIPHIVKGQWIVPYMPAKIIGAGLGIQFFYHNMRRLGNGLKSDPDLTIPKLMFLGTIETLTGALSKLAQSVLNVLSWGYRERTA